MNPCTLTLQAGLKPCGAAHRAEMRGRTVGPVFQTSPELYVTHKNHIFSLYYHRPLTIRNHKHGPKNLHVSPHSPSPQCSYLNAPLATYMHRQFPPKTKLLTKPLSSTGATGYIGGDALFALHKAHPEFEYAALVRDSGRGAAIAASYPRVRMIYGTLDDSSLLEEESGKADVVLRKYYHRDLID